jgi:hypothetical protein
MGCCLVGYYGPTCDCRAACIDLWGLLPPLLFMLRDHHFYLWNHIFTRERVHIGVLEQNLFGDARRCCWMEQASTFFHTITDSPSVTTHWCLFQKSASCRGPRSSPGLTLDSRGERFDSFIRRHQRHTLAVLQNST